MNKKILYLSLAVVVLILSASSVTALVSPPPGIKDPTLSKVWAAILDLQNQIKNIPAGAQGPIGPTGPAGKDGTQGPAGTCNVAMVKGTATNRDTISPPAGFTLSTCDIIVRPHLSGVSLHITYDEEPYYAQVLAFGATEIPPNWGIVSYVTYFPEGTGSSVNLPQTSDYTIVCKS